MTGGLDGDFFPFDRRPALEMLSIEFNNRDNNGSEYIEYALQIIPELATYQLRYILTLIVSKNPTETNEILWIKSNEEILNLWNFSKNSIKNMSRINKIGAIYLDKSKKFHFSNSFEKFISENFQIDKFEINQLFKETQTNSQKYFIKAMMILIFIRK